MLNRVAIIGTGQTPHQSRRFDVNEQELIAESVRSAIMDAEIEVGDIDATVFGSAITSIQDGIEQVGKLVVDSMGGVFKPSFRLNTGGTVGASCVLAGFSLVASGEFDIVLVSSGTIRAGASGARSQKALQMVADPIYTRSFSGGAIMGLAMSSRLYMEATGATEEHAGMCVVEARKNARRNPYAHLKEEVTLKDVLSSSYIASPLKLLDICPTSIGSGAVILASEGIARGRRCAWIKGFSSAGEPGVYPERDTLKALPVRTAAKKAYEQSGIFKPKDEVQVVELYNACSFQTMSWLEALFLADDGEAKTLVERGEISLEGRLPVNPSGGVLCTNNGSDAAMLRIIESAIQVTGKAGNRQVKDVKNAVAMAWGGAQQFSIVCVLSKEMI